MNSLGLDLVGILVARKLVEEQFNFSDLPETASQPEEASLKKTTKAKFWLAPFGRIVTRYQNTFNPKSDVITVHNLRNEQADCQKC
jgi:hypothetical protein